MPESSSGYENGASWKFIVVLIPLLWSLATFTVRLKVWVHLFAGWTNKSEIEVPQGISLCYFCTDGVGFCAWRSDADPSPREP